MNQENIGIQLELLEKLQKQNMYVVQKILKKRTIVSKGTQKVMYYVRWKGYPDPKDHTWQPSEHLDSVPELVQQFQRKLEQKQKRQEKGKDNSKQYQAQTELNKYLVTNKQSLINEDQNQYKINEQFGHKKQKTQFQTKQFIQKSKIYQNHISQIKKLHKPYSAVVNLIEQNPTFIEKQKGEKNISQKKNFPQKRVIHPAKARQFSQQPKDKLKLDKSTKAQRKQTTLYGKVVNHFYKEKTLFFEVQTLTPDKKIEKIIQITNDTASSLCLKQAYDYLKRHLIRLEEENVSK